MTSGSICAQVGEAEKGRQPFGLSRARGMGEPFLSRFSLIGWGKGAGRSQQSTPCHPDKELERIQGNLPIFLGQACWGWGGSPRALPSIPHVVPLPADGKYWCCDFINKGFCEPEKHGIRMNYFLSCGLARFANLGVFGPSPGNKPKSL